MISRAAVCLLLLRAIVVVVSANAEAAHSHGLGADLSAISCEANGPSRDAPHSSGEGRCLHCLHGDRHRIDVLAATRDLFVAAERTQIVSNDPFPHEALALPSRGCVAAWRSRAPPPA
jgi:hypothetical protein